MALHPAFAAPAALLTNRFQPATRSLSARPARRPRSPIAALKSPPSPKPSSPASPPSPSSLAPSTPTTTPSSPSSPSPEPEEEEEAGPPILRILAAASVSVCTLAAIARPDAFEAFLSDPHFLVSLGLGLSAFVQTLTGFGFAIVSVGALSQIPWIAHSSVFEDIQPIAATISTAIAWAIVAPRWRQVEWRRVTPLIIASCATTPFGAVLLENLDSELVLRLLGGLIAGYSVFSVLNFKLPKAVGGKVGAWVCGGIAGLCGGAYDISSPAMVVHGQSADWGDTFRLNLMGIACANGLVLILTDFLTGRLNDFYYWDLLKYAIPTVICSLLIGLEVSKKIDGQAFTKLVYGMCFIMGTKLLLS